MTACSSELVSFDSGWAYLSAQRSGIQPLQMAELSKMAGRKGRLAAILTALQFASQFAAYLAASGSIASKPRVIADLLMASGALAEAGSLLKALPAEYVANALQGTVAISEGGCITRDMFARRSKTLAPVMSTIELPRRKP